MEFTGIAPELEKGLAELKKRSPELFESDGITVTVAPGSDGLAISGERGSFEIANRENPISDGGSTA